MKSEEDLLTEVHEMRSLMEYMHGEPLNEGDVANSQELRSTAQDLKTNMSGGLANQYEKNAVEALQGMISKIQAKGSQLTPKIKKYLKLLDVEFNNTSVVSEEVLDEGLANDIAVEYNIEALIQKIAQEKRQHLSTIAIIVSRIADGINSKRHKPN